ncbi:glycosyltransferase family protein [Maridesulfovibrio sp. FT414]|uniref:glycosyltransferase family protein n=1 Tax=Maridesulfovibrio sp. FT414 TaxID=2979469 RepID=UPI003D806A00
MGHFFRSIEIARALDREQVIFVAGGERPDQNLPANVDYRQLPGLCMNEKFGDLRPTDEGRDLEEIKAERAQSIMRIFEEEKPDIFLIELFPFGRKAFRFELIPVLDSIREGRFGNVQVVCSLRDILVERKDGGKHEEKVVKYLNKYFDMLLIHSDPAIAALDETFGLMNRIEIPCLYTGFAARRPAQGSRERIRASMGLADHEKLLIASAGGGKVGGDLMDAVLRGFSGMDLKNTRLLMLTGPFLDRTRFDELCALAAGHDNIDVERFSPDFTGLLAAADAMISMAGYNTCMDILTSCIPAAVLPFDYNHEQRMRAERIAGYIPLKVLEPKDLIASAMEDVINGLLNRNRTSPDHGINLDGSGKSAAILRESRK